MATTNHFTAFHADCLFGDPSLPEAEGAVGRITGAFGAFHGKPVSQDWIVQTDVDTFDQLIVGSTTLHGDMPIPTASIHLKTLDGGTTIAIGIVGTQISVVVSKGGVIVYSESGTPVPAGATLQFK